MRNKFFVSWLKSSRKVSIIVSIILPAALVVASDYALSFNSIPPFQKISGKHIANNSQTLKLAQGLNSQQISIRAKEFTVRIDGENSGSGVIVARSGNTYTVLTNWHVVDEPGKYSIKTADGKSHSISSSKEVRGADLAVAYFTSNKQYPVAQRGNSDKLVEGQTVYIAGYSASQKLARERIYRFYSENLIGFLSPSDVKNGYELIYSGEPQPGMSGSPILDSNSRLIGIYGLTDVDIRTSSPTLFGIPINTAEKLATRARIDLGSSVAASSTKSPLPQKKPLQKPIANSSERLIGTWGAKVFQYGKQFTIAVNLRADGTYTESFLHGGLKINQNQGRWRYSNGILYQTNYFGNWSQGRVEWISDNEAVFTIINNGNPADKGLKRRYFRQ